MSLALVGSSVSLLVPIGSKVLFDNAYPTRDYTLAQAMLAAMAGLAVASAVLGSMREVYGQVVGARLSVELNMHLSKHILQLPVSFFDTRRIGEVTSRNADLQRAISFVTGTLQSMLINGVYFFLVPPVLLYIDWRLALLSLISLPLTFTVDWISGRIQRVYYRQVLDRSADVSGIMYESLANIRTIKASVAEAEIFSEIKQRSVTLTALQRRASTLGVGSSLLNSVIRALGTLVYGLYSWRLLIDNTLSLGTFLAFSAYLGYLTGPIGQFASLFTNLQQAAVSLGRVFEYLDAPIEPGLTDQTVATSTMATAQGRRRIEFEHVTFGYDDNRTLLNDVSFSLEPGVTAIVGPSGAGKSSLVRLLLRFYEPQRGVIRVDGIDTRSMPLVTLRRTISTVTQEHGLFKGTFRENLSLGIGTVPESRIADALAIVGMDQYVLSFPHGLDTLVAEAGISLSGGQRQRLAVARALLRRAPFLVLDEATSNLDPLTEREMVSRVLASEIDATILVITHRLATIRDTPTIYYLGDGQCVGGVSHDVLLRMSSGYATLADPVSPSWGPQITRPDAQVRG